jgi:hypothetical protein
LHKTRICNLNSMYMWIDRKMHIKPHKTLCARTNEKSLFMVVQFIHVLAGMMGDDDAPGRRYGCERHKHKHNLCVWIWNNASRINYAFSNTSNFITKLSSTFGMMICVVIMGGVAMGGQTWRTKRGLAIRNIYIYGIIV